MKPALCMLYENSSSSSLPKCIAEGPVLLANAASCVALPGDVMVCSSDPLGGEAATVGEAAIAAVCEGNGKAATLNVCGEGMVFVKNASGGYACEKLDESAGPEIKLCMSYTDNARSACSEGDTLESSEMLCSISKQMRMLLDGEGKVKAMCGRVVPGSEVSMCKFYDMPTKDADHLNGLCESADEVAVMDADSFKCVSRDSIEGAVAEVDEVDEVEDAGEVAGMDEPLTVGDVEAADGEEALLETEADMDADMDEGAEEEMLADLGEEGTVGPDTVGPDTVSQPRPRPSHATLMPPMPQPQRHAHPLRIQMPPFGTEECPQVSYNRRYALGSVVYSAADNYNTFDNMINSELRCAPVGSHIKG
jgi:hypothetical protein